MAPAEHATCAPPLAARDPGGSGSFVPCDGSGLRAALASAPGPGATLAFATTLAYGGGAWLQVVHRAEGGSERAEPGFLLHWLRDSTLALPLVFCATLVALLAARRLIERSAAGPAASAAVLAGMTALVTSAAVAAAGPAHAYLFDVRHGGHELSPLLHLGRDALVALAASLPLVGAVAAAGLGRRPGAAAEPGAWRAACSRIAPAGGLAALLVAAPLGAFGLGGAQLATAQDAGSGVCPPRAPVKRFSVQAIDVDIPLNRFGDHDPQGRMYVLSNRVDDVRAQERSRQVTLGVREDPIQPLVIRANEGDCVEIEFTNNSSAGPVGMHIDGLAHDAGSSGDAVGRNASSAAARGQTRTYRWWVPREPEFEGAHYIRPGPGNRQEAAHGLFGALAVQPPGSRYLSQETGQPLESGWQAMIVPGNGRPAYREHVQVYHEIGDEGFRIPTAGGELPQVDPHTEAYRPGSRAMNYRSEPFLHRLDRAPGQESLGYSSYPFGDPATPTMRSYQGDPTKIRILHGGSEVFHVFHLHGGGIRWRFNPQSDHTYDYGDTGLAKHPATELSPSSRLDSQAFGPGESYDLEIEGGAGGVQQGAGEFLYHCHIAEHYIAGMWAFWRVYDTRQPDLEPLPGRAPLPEPVDSSGLVGRTMPDGTRITSENLDDWVRPQIPPPGVRRSDQDATVWDWTREGDVYLGEQEDTSDWPNMPRGEPGHPGAYPGDRFVGGRPRILFNPRNGRPAFPLLRTHVGQRNPFSPNGHSGAPWLGERGGPARPDGICPEGSPVRRYNVVAIDLPIRVTRSVTDQSGRIYVLAKDAADVRAGRKPAEPLAIRGNIGDCIALTLTSEQQDQATFGGFSKVNMHIHHVQFDTQASDGVISGMSYEQSVRPYRVEDPTVVSASGTQLTVTSAAKFRPGVWIGVGLGTEGIEIRQIEAVEGNVLTLDRALDNPHPAGEWAGTEFVQYRWYPDVALDNIFWHDHVDGIHNWGRGLVGQFIVEPRGSTYHDPRTGEQVESGTYVDIRTSNPLIPGMVESSFRELALWQIDENPVSDSTLNLRAEPWADRGGDPSLLFSSWTHGDPVTPLPRAYAGDPFVLRTINVGPSVDTLRMDGHRFFTEPRYLDPDGHVEGTATDAIHNGISERYTLALDGGAGGRTRSAGDYLYYNGLGRRFRQGAWGLLRVLGARAPDLQPLPGRDPGGLGLPPPQQNGGRPPEPAGAGDPCPPGAAQRGFEVDAIDDPDGPAGARARFVPAGGGPLEPLVLHAAAGECVTIRLTNRRAQARASLNVGRLPRTPESAGMNVGFGPEQTVAPGATRTYRFFADSERIGSAPIADFGAEDSGTQGLYGTLNVAPPGASFTDPVSDAPRDTGALVDVHVPGATGYRDFTVVLAEDDPRIGSNVMPYPTAVSGPALVNYRSAPRGNRFDLADPGTPMLRAYPGDPLRVHALGAPGSEQIHSFSVGGLAWPIDANTHGSTAVATRALGPWETLDAHVYGGAGGLSRSPGDSFYGDLRRPFTEAGMWGLVRTFSDPACPIRPLDGLDCVGQPSLIADLADGGAVPDPSGTSPPPAGGEGSDRGSRSAPRSGGPLLSRLRVPRRISLRALVRRGLALSLTIPDDSRALRISLLRSRGTVVSRVVRVRRGGRVSVRVRFSRRALRRIRPGGYLVRVQAGPSVRRIDPEYVQRAMLVTRR